MRTKYIDKRGWRRVKDASYNEKIISHADTQNLIGLLSIHEVTDALTVKIVGEDVCVVDRGFKWLTIMPENTNYSITVMYDAAWNVCQYYIDINYEHTLVLGEARRLDLYLDVLVLPSGKKEIVDKKDLKRALKKGSVTKEQYDFAYYVTDEVIAMLDRDFASFRSFCELCRQEILIQK